MPTATAIYARISQDRSDEGLGVKRQQEDCRALCDRRGWPVVGTYVDNDISAFGKKKRPQYEQLMVDIRAGKVDAVAVWHPDRLHRSPRELEDFIDLIESTGVQIANCTAGDWDLTTPDGRLTARIVGSVARKESEDKSRRLRRKHVELAEAGKVPGGGRRPFGFEADRVTIRESEAELIREAAADVVAGGSLRGIVVRWSEAGVETVTGAPWSTTTLRRLLMSGRIAGQREHKGTRTKAVWPGIITTTQSARLRAILSDPARASGRPTNVREYLLGGFVFCGACGAAMTSRPVYRKGHRYRRYACALDRGGCNRVGIGAEPLEEVIVEALFVRLSSKRFAKARMAQASSTDWDKLAAAIEEDEATIEQLSVDFYRDKLISREAFVAGQRAVQARLEDNRRRLARESVSTTVSVDLGDVEVLRADWDDVSLDRKRLVLAELIDRIEIAPTTRANNKFDDERVNVIWRI